MTKQRYDQLVATERAIVRKVVNADLANDLRALDRLGQTLKLVIDRIRHYESCLGLDRIGCGYDQMY